MKYVAIDLDGTLLNEQHELSSKTREYLINLQNTGVQLILCSGRSYHGIKPFADLLQIEKHNGYIISYNGGAATNAVTNELLFTNNFSEKEVRNIYGLIGELAENFVTYGERTINCKIPNERIEFSSQIMQARITRNIFVDSPKIVLQDEIEHIDKIYNDVKKIIAKENAAYNVFRSVPHLIEITPPNSDKGSGLQKLFKSEKLKGKLIAFGDGENDLTMLNHADLGVAMANAMDQVKAAADTITLSNEQDGIVYMLEKILRGEQ